MNNTELWSCNSLDFCNLLNKETSTDLLVPPKENKAKLMKFKHILQLVFNLLSSHYFPCSADIFWLFTMIFRVSAYMLPWLYFNLFCVLNFLSHASVFDRDWSYMWGSRIAYGPRSSWMSECFFSDRGSDSSVINNWLFNIF